MSDDEHGMELVIPFVAVQSMGGPYDDAAYCAGYEAGKVHALLQQGPRGVSVCVRSDNVEQLDLIAMNEGYVIDKREPFEDGTAWTWLHFTPGDSGTALKGSQR